MSERTVGATTGIVSRARALLPVDLSRWSLRRGVSAALACCIPLLAAEWTGEPALAWASLIGFWISLVDPGWPLRDRLIAVGCFVVATAIGCFVAVLLRPCMWASGAFALVWCTAAILTRVWGDTSGAAGNLAALLVVIALGADQPSSIEAAAVIAAATLAGGLWGLVLALCIVRQRVDAPLRDAVATVFRTEAAFVHDMLSELDLAAGSAPPSHQRRGAVRDAIENARTMLVAARRARFGDGVLLQRCSLVLGDAEEVLRALLALREGLKGVPPADLPRSALVGLAARLEGLAAAVTARDGAAAPSPVVLAATDGSADALRHAIAWTEAASRHLSGPTDAATPTHAIVEERPIGRLDQLRNNLTFDSLSMRHALRFAVTAAGLTVLTKGLHLDMGYWITLTAVIILQAYPSATWLRAVQRVLGTLLGASIATMAAYVLQGPVAVLVVIAPLSLLAMAVQSASYAIYIVCITPMFILITELFSNGGVLSPALGGVRLLDNLLGAAAGMLATVALWPSWESRYLRRRLAHDLRANGTFVLRALDSRRGGATRQRTDDARRVAGLAGNNAEASLRRALDEPRRRPADEIAAALLITAVSRRFSGIAAAIVQSGPGAAGDSGLAARRQAFQQRLEETATAIEQARRPTSMRPRLVDAPEDDPIGQILARAERQLAVAQEAARRLAAPNGPDDRR